MLRRFDALSLAETASFDAYTPTFAAAFVLRLAMSTATVWMT
jgi:hypothetical protein